MKKNLIIFLAFFGCFLLITGCSAKHKNDTQKKLRAMSDAEIINHYEMIEMRMADIDFKTERSIDNKKDLNDNHAPENRYNHLGHLHIGDTWYELKKERDLTRKEMQIRGISLPYN
jgi:hypothetical protein